MKIEFKFYDERKNEIINRLNCSVTQDGDVQSFNVNGDMEGVLNNRHLIPIMYTGKRCVQGKKIYDGFIVERESVITGVVKFEQCQWWIMNEKEERAVPLFSETAKDRIIGNIYQDRNMAKGLGA